MRTHGVKIYETPNCFTEAFYNSITDIERENFYSTKSGEIVEYAKSKGILEYDDRKININK